MSLKNSFFRWVAFALGFLLTLGIGFTGITFAAGNGWIFGDILNKILFSGDYTHVGEDGTVRNAQNLGGFPAANYQKTIAGQSCGGGMCIAGVNSDGTIICH